MTVTARKYDANGWFEVPDNPLSKVGVFPYSAASVGFPGWEENPSKVVMVYRPEEELADPEAAESFKLSPWVDDHTMLGNPDADPALTAAENKGVHGVVGEKVWYDKAARILRGNLKLWSHRLAGLIDSGKKELSCGYRCVYEFTSGVFEGQRFDAIQRQIRGNHLASVDRGRMGPGVAVLDHLTFTFDAMEFANMAVKTKMKRRDALAKKLKMSAADAALLFTGTGMDEEVEVEETDEGGKGVTIEALAAQIEAMAPAIAQIGAIQEALAKLSPAVAAAAPDEVEPALDANKQPMTAADGSPLFVRKKKAGTGQDSAVVAALDGRLSAAEKTLQAFAADGVETLLAEVAKRDALVQKVTPFIGAFDHAKMTTAAVAKYAIDKLELKNIPAGQEVTALDAYLLNRPKPTDNVFALKPGTAVDGGKNPVDTYLSGQKAAS